MLSTLPSSQTTTTYGTYPMIVTGGLVEYLRSSILTLLFQGVGRRYSHLVCRKADIDPSKRAGELADEEVGPCESSHK